MNYHILKTACCLFRTPIGLLRLSCSDVITVPMWLEIKGWFMVMELLLGLCRSQHFHFTSSLRFPRIRVNVQNWPFIISAWLAQGRAAHARTHARSRQVFVQARRLWGLFTPSTDAGWNDVVFTGGPSAKMLAGSQSHTHRQPFIFKSFQAKVMPAAVFKLSSMRALEVGPLCWKGGRPASWPCWTLQNTTFFSSTASSQTHIYSLNNKTLWSGWWLRLCSLTWDLLKGNMCEAETFGDASFPHLAAIPRLKLCSGCHRKQWKSTNESL